MSKGPYFIGIGAQRAGTTWIYHCLYEHPQIYIPIKEPCFFSLGNQYSTWTEGLNWYESLFKNCPSEAKAGEFSTSYLINPKAPELIYENYPDIKLIVSLRNPVDRAYSNYVFDKIYGFIDSKISFDTAIRKHPWLLTQGCYATLLKRYLNYFSKDQILILIYEDALENPLKQVQSIYKFLDINSSFVPSMLNKKINKGIVPKSIQLHRLLAKTFRYLQFLSITKQIQLKIMNLLAPTIIKLNTKKIDTAQLNLSNKDRQQLKLYFKGEIKELEEIIGRKLIEWY